ncbi:MAG: prepilin peptidase [Coriobacteriia bacterium]|nr:prepilin peptidase [Coriobacteriia bacterium]MBN2822645.1 prepilin peptidase [Coriobacteriia bacterium]
MVEVPYWFLLMALGGFGLLFGSFANVIIWRFPRGESLAFPGSHCPACSAPINWYDNVPVVSWLLLRGRCRACKEAIPFRYPAVELLSGILWIVAGIRFGLTGQTFFAVLLFYMLLVLTFIDIDHKRLPNGIVALLGVAGLVGIGASSLSGVNLLPLVALSAGSSPLASAALGVLLGGGLSLAISVAYGALRGSVGLGMGDVKLLAVLGLFLGPYVLMTFMIGSMIGAVYGLTTSHRAAEGISQRIPFGPFLASGAVITALFGPAAWAAYARLVGLS